MRSWLCLKFDTSHVAFAAKTVAWRWIERERHGEHVGPNIVWRGVDGDAVRLRDEKAFLAEVRERKETERNPPVQLDRHITPRFTGGSKRVGLRLGHQVALWSQPRRQGVARCSSVWRRRHAQKQLLPFESVSLA